MIRWFFTTAGVLTILAAISYQVLNRMDNGIEIKIPMSVNDVPCQLFDCAAELQKHLLPVAETAAEVVETANDVVIDSKPAEPGQ